MDKSQPMDDERQTLLRDPDELEGTLLLPTAQPVSDADAAVTGDDNGAIPVLAYATAPDSHFEYDEQDVKEAKVEILEAPAVPTFSNLKDSMRDKQLLDRGCRKGQIDAEEEIDTIRKNNLQVFSKNYHAIEQVKQANERAASLLRKEQAGWTFPAPSSDEEDIVLSKPKKNTEFYEGSYGKEYEVAKYDVRTYDTRDYNVSEYKSVYESKEGDE